MRLAKGPMQHAYMGLEIGCLVPESEASKRTETGIHTTSNADNCDSQLIINAGTY